MRVERKRILVCLPLSELGRVSEEICSNSNSNFTGLILCSFPARSKTAIPEEFQLTVYRINNKGMWTLQIEKTKFFISLKIHIYINFFILILNSGGWLKRFHTLPQCPNPFCSFILRTVVSLHRQKEINCFIYKIFIKACNRIWKIAAELTQRYLQHALRLF